MRIFVMQSNESCNGQFLKPRKERKKPPNTLNYELQNQFQSLENQSNLRGRTLTPARGKRLADRSLPLGGLAQNYL